MNLSTARGWVRQFARNAQDSSIYGDAAIDRALQTVGARFCRNTKALSGAVSSALAINDTTFEFDFNPLIQTENLLDLTLSDSRCPLRLISYLEMNALRQASQSGTPTRAAIVSNIQAPIYTAASAAGAGDFSITSDITKVPPNFGPGWLATYFGQTQRVVTWDVDNFTGTLDAPFSSPMEGGHVITFQEWASPSAPASTSAANFAVLLYPTNNAVRTITARFWIPFTQWLPGLQGDWSSTQQYRKWDIVELSGNLYQATQASLNHTPPNGAYWLALGAGSVPGPAAVELNIPDDWLNQILPFGPAAMLQLHEPENAKMAASKWAEYQVIEKGFGSAGSLGVDSSPRSMQW